MNLLLKSKKFLKDNWIIITIFLVELAYFFIQHYKFFSWDFEVYSMNGRYFIGKSTYFEWLRPPLMPLLFTVFSFLGNADSYVIIFLILLFFYYSVYLFCKKYSLNYKVMMMLYLVPVFVGYSFFAGTELLALTFILLFITFLDTRYSGIFLGLAFLTRYTTLIFALLIFFNKKIKNYIYFAVGGTLVVLPWLIYNYIKKSNFLFSMLDSYLLNIVARGNAINLKDIYPIGFFGFLLILFFIGIYYRMKNIKKLDIIMLLVVLITIYSFIKIPYKDVRYMFFLILPLTYFGYFAYQKYKKIFLTVVLLNLIVVIVMFFYIGDYKLDQFNDALKNVDECGISSNGWVMLNSIGRASEPAPYMDLVEDRIDKGYRLILFNNIFEPEYKNDMTFMSKFDIIYKNDRYAIYGDKNKCAKLDRYELVYMERYKEHIQKVTGQKIELTTFNIIFNKI